MARYRQRLLHALEQRASLARSKLDALAARRAFTCIEISVAVIEKPPMMNAEMI